MPNGIVRQGFSVVDCYWKAGRKFEFVRVERTLQLFLRRRGRVTLASGDRLADESP